MLKLILESLEGLDEATQKLYKKEADGKYRLQVEGATEKGKLDEFRDNNKKLMEEVAKLKGQLDQYTGIDPTKYKELTDKMSSMEEKRLLSEGKIEEVISLRVAGIKRDMEQQIAAKDQLIKTLTTEKDGAFQERDRFIIDAELRRAIDSPDFAFQAGVGDLLRRQVLDEFKYKDGKVVRVKPDGSLVYGKGGEPASLTEFLSDISKERPYLVRPSSGGGANNGAKGGSGGKTVRRAEFDAMGPLERQQVLAEKTAIVD